MAFVVARPRGRFEIRESVHTSAGPRARSLANFARLSPDVLERAASRASTRFDREAVLRSAHRRGAPVEQSAELPTGNHTVRPGAELPTGNHTVRPGAELSTENHSVAPEDDAARHFVDASRRFAASIATGRPGRPADPGRALIDLIGFAEEVVRQLPPRAPEPLRFPVLSRLPRTAGAG